LNSQYDGAFLSYLFVFILYIKRSFFVYNIKET
jgi:hypothetical protein